MDRSDPIEDGVRSDPHRNARAFCQHLGTSPDRARRLAHASMAASRAASPAASPAASMDGTVRVFVIKPDTNARNSPDSWARGRARLPGGRRRADGR
jgi:hypothetical protein